MLITKEPVLYIYNCTSKYLKKQTYVKKEAVLQFYVRLYYKGSTAQFISCKTLESLPSNITNEYLDTI